MVDKDTKVPTFKVVMLGEGEVGKTSLLMRYLHNQFQESMKRTVPQFGNNASYLEKRVDLDRYRQQIQLNLWDTAGQERYAAIAPIYYKNADAAVAVYNSAMRESSQKVDKWVQEIKQYSDNKHLVVVIVGNKCDLIHQKDPEKTGEKIAEKHQCKHFYTSCKTGKNVNEMFMELSEALFNTHQSSGQKKKKGKLLITEEHNSLRSSYQRAMDEQNADPKKKGGCC